MIKNIFFDLDCTLLHMDQDRFLAEYFRILAEYAKKKLGVDGREFVHATEIGVYQMLNNDGLHTNEEAYYNQVNKIYPDVDLYKFFDDFYKLEFPKLEVIVDHQTKSKELIEYLKNKGYNLVLATNPVFPRICTAMRVCWAGLNPNDFIYISTFENSCFTKPKREYYQEILNKLNMNPKETIMIGNDIDDDFSMMGDLMKKYLLTDCLINKHNKEIDIPSSTITEFINYLKLGGEL